MKKHPLIPTPAPRLNHGPVLLAWFVIAMSLGAGSLSAADWPTYQHDNQRSGVTSEPLELPLTAEWVYQPMQNPSPAWPAPAKRDFYLSPSAQRPLKPRVAFDRAYHVAIAGTSLFFGSSTDHTITSLNIEKGTTNWSFFTDGPVRMAPSVAGDRVYAGSDDGSVYCLKTDDGSLVWRYNPAGTNHYLIANDGRFVSPFAIRSSVVVDQGIAYFTAGFFPHEGVYLCAVDAATGEQKTSQHWQRRLVNQAAFQGYMLLSPTRIYMPSSRSNPFLFDRVSGSTLGQVRGSMGTFALLAGDAFVYGPAARGGGQLTEASPSGDTLATHNNANAMIVTANRSYLLTDGALIALQRPGGQEQWRQQPMAFPYALILADKTLFAGGDNQVAAFDANTGEQIWSAPVQGTAYGLAVAHGRLFVSTDQGRIHSFRQDRSRKQSQWIIF